MPSTLMSGSSVNTRLEFLLTGLPINAPAEWTDIEINASFDDDGVQASIGTESFRFVNINTSKSSNIIRDWVSNDNPGIFHGVPFQIKGKNNVNSLNVFDGYLNLVDGLEYLEDGSTVANIIKKDGLDDLNLRLEALNWGFLKLSGDVTQADYTTVSYVVEKKFNFFEILMSNIVLFLLVKELQESITRLAQKIADAAAHLTGGISGSAAAAAWSVATAIIQLLYTTLIAIAVINLGNRLLETLLPRVRQHKAIQLRRAMTIVANKLGYGFVSPITELDNVYFLPSNTEQDNVSAFSGLITQLKGIQNGVPHLTDPGYNCLDFFKYIQQLTNSRFAIENGNIQFRSKNDPYWVKTATYVMPDVQVNQLFNAADMKARWALLMAIDNRDEWTIDNYQGTSYEVQTDAINTPDIKAKFILGRNEINIPWSLGNRKDELNGIERLLKSVAQFLDTVVNTLGGSSNLAGKINNKIGMLKVTHNNHTKPKLLYLTGGKLPINHRTQFSAKVMWDKYHNEQSWVQNNYGQQRLVFKGVKIPFGLESFLQLVNNSYFHDPQNRKGKMTNLRWNMFGDFAIVDFWIQEPYTKNLKESFIEAT